MLAPGAGAAGSVAGVPFSVVGTETGALAGEPGAVRLETAPLTRDVRLVGAPTVRIGMTTGRTWATLAPSVVDVDPSGSAGPVAVTRGWVDTRYARSLSAQQRGDGRSLSTVVTAKPTDYVFRKGHRIALVVTTSSTEWTLPKAYDGLPAAHVRPAARAGYVPDAAAGGRRRPADPLPALARAAWWEVDDRSRARQRSSASHDHGARRELSAGTWWALHDRSRGGERSYASHDHGARRELSAGRGGGRSTTVPAAGSGRTPPTITAQVECVGGRRTPSLVAARGMT